MFGFKKQTVRTPGIPRGMGQDQTPSGKGMREKQTPLGKGITQGGAGPGGVLAMNPNMWPRAATDMRVTAPPAATVWAGRFQYQSSQPRYRLGPTPKLAPGTGGTGPGVQNTVTQASGYGATQFIPVSQFDYNPNTIPYVGIQNEMNSSAIPRSIRVGNDGRDIVGTYQPHDFTPADRFFKQGRSSANWQDMSFGPDYRYLLPQQQVARYNLYNSVQMSRPLSPNAYFLGYQTQPAIAAQIAGAGGLGRPLGY